jgi:hypothetical protein
MHSEQTDSVLLPGAGGQHGLGGLPAETIDSEDKSSSCTERILWFDNYLQRGVPHGETVMPYCPEGAPYFAHKIVR